MDTTQDISKTDQLSQVIRYVTITKDKSGKPSELKINESFLGFKAIFDQTASGLERAILQELDDMGLSLTKCRGQGYDGAATMSGTYKGLQTRIQKIQKSAKYVHCAAHVLNLVLNDAMIDITENKCFYDIVEKLYVFFSDSIKRWELLSSNLSLKLKRLCPTRWSSRVESVRAVRESYVEILKALSAIILMSKKKEERATALGLKEQLEKFEFIFQIVFYTKILDAVNLVSKLMQSQDFDLSEASNLLENATLNLSKLRNSFSDVKTEAATLAKKWGVENQFKTKRFKKVKRHFDELSQDERLTNPEKRFEVSVFNRTVDVVMGQVEKRFSSLKELAALFVLLTPKFMLSATDTEIDEKSILLFREYEDDLSEHLASEVRSFRIALKNDIEKKSSVRELAELLFLDHSTLTSSLPDLSTAFLLFLTLPVTVSTAERSFSKLKLIKNYLRSTMSQERLKCLGILSIENGRARNLNLRKVITTFASQNSRREKQFRTPLKLNG